MRDYQQYYHIILGDYQQPTEQGDNIAGTFYFTEISRKFYRDHKIWNWVASFMLTWDFDFVAEWGGLRNADEAQHIENISGRMSRAFIEWKSWNISSFCSLVSPVKHSPVTRQSSLQPPGSGNTNCCLPAAGKFHNKLCPLSSALLCSGLVSASDVTWLVTG